MPAIYAPNETDAAHVEAVAREMETLGAPEIRAVETAHGLVAIEGSHRLAAAELLGLAPTIVVIDADELVEGSTLNDIRGDVWINCACEGDSINDFRVSGAELAAFAASPAGAYHTF